MTRPERARGGVDGFDGLPLFLAIDENVPASLHDPTEERDVAQFTLGEEDQIDRESDEERDHVGVALVVGEQDAAVVGRDPLAAMDVDLEAPTAR
jgi:hypothetical protein